jgi:3-methyl-2-oxobutanoate hydroxymethyltransferase
MPMTEPPIDRITIPILQARKAAREKIVALTAYDYPTAEILDRLGVDLILVGDSVAMVVLGRENTVSLTVDELLHHLKPVARAARRALVVADMPFLSFRLSGDDAVRNAARFIQEGGAGAVKIEGASPFRLDVVRRLVDAEIPVLGHIGLTPQSILRQGRFEVQGGEAPEGARIVREAEALEAAGVFAVVLECVPREVAAEITGRLSIPTFGIGAGSSCDGQILVFHDLVGCSRGTLPKFVRKYAEMDRLIGRAVAAYGRDVRSGKFPDDRQSYHLKPEAARRFRALFKSGRRRGAKKEV